MKERLPAIERAFELAKSGTVGSLTQIDKVLAREGYPVRVIEGPFLRKQLTALIIAARSRPVIVKGSNEHQE